ncbi:MAG: Rho termination factor N-terminal domain-containing protein [Phycisphaerae bacterium]|nr:Rho termination factor N-terminal domain-containing protein [Phycisphaerae bacterium]
MAMTMSKIKKKAKDLGVEAGTMNKIDLIRKIQCSEGNFPCFGTTNGHCSQPQCCFAEDCLKIVN